MVIGEEDVARFRRELAVENGEAEEGEEQDEGKQYQMVPTCCLGCG